MDVNMVVNMDVNMDAHDESENVVLKNGKSLRV